LRALYHLANSRLIWGAVLIAALGIHTGCATRRTTRIPTSQVPRPALEASADELVAHLNQQSEAIKTLVAKVQLEPTAGSIYSGVIKEYHDVRAFILLQAPSLIRIQGQAPVVGTEIFDMVSDGQNFKLSIPPKQKFIVGTATFHRPVKNSLENLRPQHILDALLIRGIDPATERTVFQEDEEDGKRYYAISVLADGDQRSLRLERKIWFDRSDLEISRLQLFGPKGSFIEDVEYSNYQDFDGTHYPSRIQITRPIEDYRLTITVQSAKFNEPIPSEKFVLEKPTNEQLVDLNAPAKEGQGDQ
jgi:hypothetical protein